MVQKKISQFMGISMGITMSLTMSLIGSFLGSVFFSYLLPNVILKQPTERPVIQVVLTFLASFGVSLIISMVIALGLGFIVPMKKINDAIERKVGKKGLKTHFFQSLASDCIYTVIISIAMAVVMAQLFAIPQQIKGFESQIAGQNGKLAGLQAELEGLQNQPAGEVFEKMTALNNEIEATNETIKKLEVQKARVTLLPVSLKNWITSFPFEFIIALIVIMIVEPIFQKIAFKKYIPKDSDEIL